MTRTGQYIESATIVLRRSRRPMSTKEIVTEALAGGLLQPGGKTPEATMSAALYTHIRDVEGSEIVRVHEEGISRARRGSVRWTLRKN